VFNVYPSSPYTVAQTANNNLAEPLYMHTWNREEEKLHFYSAITDEPWSVQIALTKPYIIVFGVLQIA
jgi:hypothetical protein